MEYKRGCAWRISVARRSREHGLDETARRVVKGGAVPVLPVAVDPKTRAGSR